jgi:hypothetical protein
MGAHSDPWRRVAGELSVAAVLLAGASVDIDGAQRSS